MPQHQFRRFSHRPPWWPENEPWPPARGHRMRGNFLLRIGCLLAFILLMLMVIAVALVGFISKILDVVIFPQGVSGWVLPVSVLALFLGVNMLAFTARGLRRISLPINELVEAAGRLADGDYSVRVAERGPSEVRTLAGAFNSMAGSLQTAYDQRRDLLADITHELRTPLTVIQGNLEGMLDGVYPPDDARLKAVLEETQLLTRLVDDLRTLALAETGALPLAKAPTDLAVLLNETAAVYAGQASAAGVTLEVSADGDLPLVDLDPARIREVVANLIANALRYTPSGGAIRVSCTLTGGDSHQRVEVSVVDSGAGISAEDLPHIFDRFYKTRDSSGTGLGLAIARKIVEAHGGEIQAQSQPGHGAAIRFNLPLQ